MKTPRKKLKVPNYYGIKPLKEEEELRTTHPVSRGFVVGQKVRFKTDWDIYPFAYVKKGEVGKIVDINDMAIHVKLNKYHDGLDTWDNEAHIYFDELAPICPEDVIEVIRRTK